MSFESRHDDELLPHEIEGIARQIAERANAGRTVRLLPKTARLAAAGLRRVARPVRHQDVVAVICGKDRCDLRNSCYGCIGKANIIMRLLKDGREST